MELWTCFALQNTNHCVNGLNGLVGESFCLCISYFSSQRSHVLLRKIPTTPKYPERRNRRACFLGCSVRGQINRPLPRSNLRFRQLRLLPKETEEGLWFRSNPLQKPFEHLAVLKQEQAQKSKRCCQNPLLDCHANRFATFLECKNDAIGRPTTCQLKWKSLLCIQCNRFLHRYRETQKRSEVVYHCRRAPRINPCHRAGRPLWEETRW